MLSPVNMAVSSLQPTTAKLTNHERTVYVVPRFTASPYTIECSIPAHASLPIATIQFMSPRGNVPSEQFSHSERMEHTFSTSLRFRHQQFCIVISRPMFSLPLDIKPISQVFIRDRPRPKPRRGHARHASGRIPADECIRPFRWNPFFSSFFFKKDSRKKEREYTRQQRTIHSAFLLHFPPSSTVIFLLFHSNIKPHSLNIRAKGTCFHWPGLSNPRSTWLSSVSVRPLATRTNRARNHRKASVTSATRQCQRDSSVGCGSPTGGLRVGVAVGWSADDITIIVGRCCCSRPFFPGVIVVTLRGHRILCLGMYLYLSAIGDHLLVFPRIRGPAIGLKKSSSQG